MTITDIYQCYLLRTWNPTPTPNDLITMGMGLCGEAGEASEHFKKVIRNYDGNFKEYPPAKRNEARLEYGDALHYLLKQAGQFGFTLEGLMAANMDKLDKRYEREPWRKSYGYVKGA